MTISRPLGAPLAFDEENVSSGTTTFCGAPITRSGSAERTYSAVDDLPAIAVDFDLEVRGGEIGDLAAVAVERGDVNGDELDAGAEDGLGAWVPGCLRARRLGLAVAAIESTISDDTRTRIARILRRTAKSQAPSPKPR